MKKARKIIFLTAVLFFLGTALSFAGLVYQDFEPNNGSIVYGLPGYQTTVGFSSAGEPVHSGTRSWKAVAQYQYGGTTIEAQVQAGNVDFKPSKNDRLSFWIYGGVPFPWGGFDTVGVKFFDNNLYASNGFTVWTTKTFFNDQWTKLYVLFSQLPADFDLAHVNKIEFVFL